MIIGINRKKGDSQDAGHEHRLAVRSAVSRPYSRIPEQQHDDRRSIDTRKNMRQVRSCKNHSFKARI